MKIYNKILIFIIALFFVGELNAQNVSAWASIDTNAITIGDRLKYEVGVTMPENAQVQWPMYVDTLTSNIEILNRSKIDTASSKSGISIRQQYIITSFDSGYFEIPPAIINYRVSGDTNLYSVSSNTLFLQVYVPEVDTTKAIKPIITPISEPYTLKELLPWILGSFAFAIIIAFLIYYLLKRRKNQPVFKRKPKPKLPAHVIAISKLEELRFNKLWQAGLLKKYYSELTDIIREYLANRYEFDAQEMTSAEIISTLGDYDVNKDAMNKLQGVMYLSDMVKFAKATPTAMENDLGIAHCVDFVNETKKVPEAKPTESSDNENTKLNGK